MPAQLSWIVFPAKEPPWALATRMPHGPPEMRLPTTLASLLARSGPKMAMPAITGAAHIVGEDLGAGRVEDEHADRVLSVMSLERILVPSIEQRRSRITPYKIALTIIPRDRSARMASTTMPAASVSGLPITWLFAIVVLTLASDDPASDIACDTVSHNSSVASAGNVDHERPSLNP